MNINTLTFILSMPLFLGTPGVFGVMYWTPRPLIGVGEERQIDAERVCRAVCADRGGWNSLYMCYQRVRLDEFSFMHHYGYACACDCNYRRF
jgi:hypothetical protein